MERDRELMISPSNIAGSTTALGRTRAFLTQYQRPLSPTGSHRQPYIPVWFGDLEDLIGEIDDRDTEIQILTARVDGLLDALKANPCLSYNDIRAAELTRALQNENNYQEQGN